MSKVYNNEKECEMNLKDESIFILATAKFDGPFESTSYTIARKLAEQNDVYYLDYPYTWKDYVKKDPLEAWNVRQPYFSRSSDGIMNTDLPRLKIVITPPLISTNFLPEGFFYRALLRYNENLIVRRIKRIIKNKGINNYLYINSFNFHYPTVANKLSPDLTIYQCVDPLIRQFDRKHGLISEEQIVRSSDVVICTSRQLYEEKRKENSNTFFIPNAADISHSMKALDADLAVHPAIASIPRPVVGYFGNIERRIDYDLLRTVIENNTQKSFVFAGPVSKEYVPEWFFQVPNVYFPGRFDYSEMPSVIKGFDVAIIPFKKDEVSQTIFPLKLFEYLGAGKPVVATNFNSHLSEFTGNTVPYCADWQSFSGAINRSMALTSEEDRKERIDIASQNTWDHRLRTFEQIICRYKRAKSQH